MLSGRSSRARAGEVDLACATAVSAVGKASLAVLVRPSPRLTQPGHPVFGVRRLSPLSFFPSFTQHRGTESGRQPRPTPTMKQEKRESGDNRPTIAALQTETRNFSRPRAGVAHRWAHYLQGTLM